MASSPDDQLTKEEPASVLLTTRGPSVHHKIVAQKILVEERSE